MWSESPLKVFVSVGSILFANNLCKDLYMLQFLRENMLTHGYRGTEKCKRCYFRQCSLIKVGSSSIQGQIFSR